METAKKLVKAINSGDVPAIESMMDGPMQQFLPPEKAAPFFGGIVAAGGKLKDVGEPRS